MHRCVVGSNDDVWVEQREQRVEIALARGGQEGIDNFSLTGEVGVRNCGVTPDPAACAARELPGRGGGASHDASDLIEGQVEHVVQHECDPLRGGQCFEHHEQRETY